LTAIAAGRPHLSVVAPVYREEGNVAEFCRRVAAAVEGITKDYEIVLVEDGGGDGSWARIVEESRRNRRVKGLRFARNFGQHYAITAGLSAARGDWVVVMDSDLQDRPEVIPELYAKARQGFEIVFVARRDRPEALWYRAAQRLFFALFRWLAGTDYDPAHGNFSILSRRVLAHYLSLNEQLRFYGGMVAWLGFPRASIEAAHGRRHAGSSVYTLRNRLRLAGAIVVAHSDRPLRLSIGFGFLMAAGAFAYGVALILRALLGQIAVPGYASVMVSIFFIGGLVLLVQGIVGVYIGKIYAEARRRPLYVVAETIGLPPPEIRP
jgi:glycosyltransferase involved in cell wall biosynthesis